MSRLDELINELCPNGVEYKKLGKVCDFQNGYAFKSTKFASTGCPILRITNINNGLICTDNLVFFNKEDYKENLEQYKVRKGDIVIAMSGATTGKIGKSGVEYELYLNQRAGKFIPRKELDNGYLFHILLSQTNTFYKLALGGAQPNLSTASIKELQIPVPPLPVQEEIVRILDKYTTLEAKLEEKLEAELEARKQQYEYYRDKLFTFDNSNKSINETQVVWKTINDICVNICSGGTPSRSISKYYEGNIPWLRTQEVDWKDVYDTELKITEEAISNSSAKLIPANCVIIAMYGATAAKSCINKIPLTTNQACCNLEINEHIATYKYVYYWLCCEYENLRALGEGSQSNINGKKIKNYKIPIPPLEEQHRIVSILDKFEKLTTDLTQGLPAEIEARRQQYEYYRDKLLTFKRKTA